VLTAVDQPADRELEHREKDRAKPKPISRLTCVSDSLRSRFTGPTSDVKRRSIDRHWRA
jgi:hypothetical protein